MPAPRRRPLAAGVLALGLAGPGLLAGCGGDVQRPVGDQVTADEAGVLGGLLSRNAEQGGAAFVASAPYGSDGVLTLTGEVDLAGRAGRAQAVADPGDGGPELTRTVFFTADDVWLGDVPGLADALTAAGLPAASYVRRPLAEGDAPPLTDVLVRVVLGLSAEEADDPAAFLDGGYRWQGDRSIDGELTSVYGAESGWTVAVDRSSDLLVQFVAPVGGTDATVTLSEHGPRTIALPRDEETVDGPAHPEVAATVGL
ncbi:hypothetical protein ACI8AC_05155 [Geodermatophilus sp. SYSU D00758]